MKAIEVKGLRIGEGMPKAIIPIMPESAKAAHADAVAAAQAGADCIELRLDFCDQACNPHAAPAFAQAVKDDVKPPVLVTFRSKGQGGRMTLETQDYVQLVGALIDAGAADLIDIEIGAGEDEVTSLCARAKHAGIVPVVSFHDFEKTPDAEYLEELLARMERLGAGICKFATMAACPADALSVMQATERFARVSEVPLITMAMGPHGGITRLTGELFGSSMTFCSLAMASAPGQVQIDKARQIMRDIHEVSHE